MRIPRIYYEGELVRGHELTLPLETSHYLLHVLRSKKGGALILFNGTGGQYRATVTELLKKHICIRVDEFEYMNT